MRNSSHTSESPSLADGQEQRTPYLERAKERMEHLKKRPYRTAALGILGVSTVVGVPVGFDLASDNVAAYHQRIERTSPVEATGGDVKVQEIDVNLNELCLVAYTTRVEDATASLTWKEGIFDKKKQVSVDMTVQNRYCQDATAGKAVVNHEKKTYDLYVNTEDDPDAIYLDTYVDFNKKDSKQRPFSYSFSGSGSLIPEEIADVFIENTRIKEYTVPSAVGMVMDARDSALLNVAILQGEEVSREKCADKIFDATEDYYKNNLIKTAEDFVNSVYPEFTTYEKNVYIGPQTPDDPDRKVNYSFRNQLAGDLMNAKADGGVEVETGEVGECEVADNVIVSPSEVGNE